MDVGAKVVQGRWSKTGRKYFNHSPPTTRPAKGRVSSGLARGIHFACDCDVSPMQLFQVGHQLQSGVRRVRANHSYAKLELHNNKSCLPDKAGV